MADIETNKLVIISELLCPISFPKKPEINAANKGKNNTIYSMFSILSLKFVYIFNANCSCISVINNNNS